MTQNMDTPCFPPCSDRQTAMDAGTFGWYPLYGGWVDRDLPWRTSTFRVVNPSTCQMTRHTISVGKPYTLGVCPWCGKDLPDPLEEPMMGGFESC